MILHCKHFRITTMVLAEFTHCVKGIIDFICVLILPNITLNKRYPKMAHNFSLASIGSEFVKISQVSEAGQCSNEIAFDTSSSHTLPNHNRFLRLFFSNAHWGVLVLYFNPNFDIRPLKQPLAQFSRT